MFIPIHDANPLSHLARPYVNYGLIAVTVVCFILTGGFGQAAVNSAAVGFGFIPVIANELGPFSPQNVPGPVTYVTYAFLHADWLHLLGNMAFLWVFGDNIEDALGHFKYLVFYLACAAFAAFAHALFNVGSAAPLIGASGAVAGVVGAYLMLHPRVKLWILFLGRIPLRLSALWVLGGWIAFQLFNVFAAAEGDEVAWWAHIGGFIAGVGLVVVMRRRGVPLLDQNLPRPS